LWTASRRCRVGARHVPIFLDLVQVADWMPLVTSRDFPAFSNPEGGKREATRLVAAGDRAGNYPS